MKRTEKIVLAAAKRKLQKEIENGLIYEPLPEEFPKMLVTMDVLRLCTEASGIKVAKCDDGDGFYMSEPMTNDIMEESTEILYEVMTYCITRLHDGPMDKPYEEFGILVLNIKNFSEAIFVKPNLFGGVTLNSASEG